MPAALTPPASEKKNPSAQRRQKRAGSKIVADTSRLSDNAEPAKTSYKQHLCIKGILEYFMRLKSLFAVITFTLLLASLPARAGTKEQLIQLQTQVQALQDQMARMQQSFDERMGVMRNLV